MAEKCRQSKENVDLSMDYRMIKLCDRTNWKGAYQFVLRCSLENVLSGKYVMNIELILKQLVKCNISSPLEQAHFLAQCEHESANFKHLSESSNYRYKSAKLVFGKYKAQIEAKQSEEHAADDSFCPQPWLFDLVYGTRMGNQLDGTNDHDGFNFRGGGLLQLTGKDNYAKFLEFANTHGRNLAMHEIAEFTRSDEGAMANFQPNRNIQARLEI